MAGRWFPDGPGSRVILALLAAALEARAADASSPPSPSPADTGLVRAAIPDSVRDQQEALRRGIFLMDLAHGLRAETDADTLAGLSAQEREFVKQKYRQLHP
jgi:hypothetical protein